jgi:hypothetical protein
MEMSKRVLWAVVAVSAMAALPMACKKSTDTPAAYQGGVGYGTDPNQPYGAAGTPGYGTPGAYPTATTTAPATATPTATATATGGSPDMLGQLGGMVGGLLGGLGAGVPGADPLSAGIQYNAQQNAPGMRADGSPVKLTLSQGQTGEGQVTLQPGKCYTLVGASMPGVIDVSVKATYPAPMQAQVLGQSMQSGPMPVVFAKDACYRNPAPIGMPVRVEVTMKQGSGQVAIQPYSK